MPSLLKFSMRYKNGKEESCKENKEKVNEEGGKEESQKEKEIRMRIIEI